MRKILTNDWAPLLEAEFEKPYYQRLRQYLIQEYHHYDVYPDMYHIYLALQLTAYAETKVVILGQDPYHGPGQAHGLSFSVQPGVAPPPSLQNIFKELESDLGCKIPDHGCLEAWAKQGVLLLNTVLTVRKGVPNSHRGKGWEAFTDAVISLLDARETPVVFMLWGANAGAKRRLITRKHHFLIETPHPSPLSAYRGFFGSRPFSKANDFLKSVGIGEINWQLPELSSGQDVAARSQLTSNWEAG